MPNYRVWRPDYDETEEDAVDHKWEYEAYDVEAAAEKHAEHFHNQRDGWESSWPVTFRVKALATGKVFDVEVDRHTVPEFEAGKPKEVV